MSVHNVEVYRCRACQEKVVTVGEGIELTEAELASYAQGHRQVCQATLERIPDDEG